MHHSSQENNLPLWSLFMIMCPEWERERGRTFLSPTPPTLGKESGRQGIQGYRTVLPAVTGAQRRWAGGGVHTTHHCQKEHSDTAALLLQGRGKSSLSFKRKPQASSNSNGNKSLYQLRALPFTKPFPCLFTITYILGNLLLLGLQRRKWMFPEVK